DGRGLAFSAQSGAPGPGCGVAVALFASPCAGVRNRLYDGSDFFPQFGGFFPSSGFTALFPFDRHRSRASVLDDLQRVVLRTRTSFSRYGPLAGGAIGHGCSHGAGCGQTDSLADAAGRFSGRGLDNMDSPYSFQFFSPAGVFLLPVSRCDFDGLVGCDHRWRVVGSPRIFPLEGLLTSAGWDSVGMGLVQVWIEYRPHADISRSGISYEEKVL